MQSIENAFRVLLKPIPLKHGDAASKFDLVRRTFLTAAVALFTDGKDIIRMIIVCFNFSILYHIVERSSHVFEWLLGGRRAFGKKGSMIHLLYIHQVMSGQWDQK